MPNEISIQLVKIHQLFTRKRKQWLRQSRHTELIPGVARRTINHHAKRLTVSNRGRFFDTPDPQGIRQLRESGGLSMAQRPSLSWRDQSRFATC